MTRVAVIGPVYPDSFAANICDGLRGLGVDAEALGSARPDLAHGSRGVSLIGDLTKAYRAANLIGDLALRAAALDERVQRRRLLPMVVGEGFDAVIVVDSLLAPAVVADLKEHVPVAAFWFPDAVMNIGRQTMVQAPYDAVFSKEPAFVEPCRDLIGLPFHYLAEACNPRHHRVEEVVEEDPAIVVVGNYYPYRIRLLERLNAVGIPLALYGNPFPRWNPSRGLDALHTGRYISGVEKSRVFRGAAAVLNVVHPSEMDGLNCRLFEAAAAGGTVLTEPRSKLETCFTPGTEVLVFSTFDELVDQARWCLDHPAEAKAMGDRAAARALAEHTYEIRLAELLRTVGIGLPGAR